MEYITDGIENLFESDLINYIVEKLIEERVDVNYVKITQKDINDYKHALEFDIHEAYSSEQIERLISNKNNVIRFKKSIVSQKIKSIINKYANFIDSDDKERIATEENYITFICDSVKQRKLPYQPNTPAIRELIRKSYLYFIYQNKINEYIQGMKRFNQNVPKHEPATLQSKIHYPKDKEEIYIIVFNDLYKYFLKARQANFQIEAPLTIDQRIKKIIQDQLKANQPIMTLEEFVKNTHVWWIKSKRTNKNLYELYVNEYNLLNPQHITNTLDTTDEIQFNRGYGYKTQSKIKHLQKNPNVKINNSETLQDKNSFPLKQNIKQFQLHTIAPRHSFIIDFMFENKTICYLVATNINTRKLFVVKTNLTKSDIANEEKKNEIEDTTKLRLMEQKTTRAYLNALKQIMQETEIKYLKGDGEKAFNSRNAQDYYEANGIQFIPVRRQAITKYPDFMNELSMVASIKNKQKTKWKTEPKHSSLGLNDRVIRTIRDLAFNLGYGVIREPQMKYIVNLYNNAPHSTLSKYAGQPVSPNDVDSNEALERFIVRRIQQDNFNIMHSARYNLKPGTNVKVYNEPNAMTKRRCKLEPGNWTVNKQVGVLFELIDEKGNTETKSRYQIDEI